MCTMKKWEVEKQLANLIQTIEDERAKLVKLGMEKGFQNFEVLEKSRLLDQLLNDYEKLVKLR
ncbi:MAG: aspartyl-phosphate phosphatase Spo0E family protein [Syntrophomonadaceae bacterium]|nr:aspartyl-phosphate phosphatase Spo0E family protein [Syntrophomonadaceae bacterium]